MSLGNRRFASVLIVAALAVLAICVSSASAAVINVTTTADENTDPGTGCGLREAIRGSNLDVAYGGCPTGTGADTIQIPAGTYNLTSAGANEEFALTGDLDLRDTDSLTIVGTGKVVIDGGNSDRVFDHNSGSGTVEIRNVAIQNGRVTGVNNGGGILNGVGTLSLDGVTVSGSSAGIDGGGVTNYATATIANTTITGNSANDSGGGLFAPGSSTTTLRNVTIAGNTADADASGAGEGGGLAAMDTVNAYNSVIANNSDSSPTPANQAPDCYTAATFFPRYTLIENFDAAKCLVGFDPGTNITGQDPSLGPLADNGGTVPTLALQPGSAAIDKGGSVAPDQCLGTDARGVTRPQGAACDLGAFERSPADDAQTPPPTTTPSAKCAGVKATITGTAKRDVIKGTKKRDVIAALGGNDKIMGLGGNDLICGGTGKDQIFGGGGKDRLVGQAGRDKLVGGAGKDRLQGGPGKDTQKQ